MSRLYVRFYFALLASLIVFAVAAALMWHRADGPVERSAETLGRLVQNVLPPAEAPPPQQALALQALARGLDADVTLLAADQTMLAVVGRPLSLPAGEMARGGGHGPGPDGPIWTIRLPDGRWLLASAPIGFGAPSHALLLMLVLLAIAVAVAAFPVVRRVTKRLERLQSAVESLGAGNLAARVAVEGRDEVARLAESFNRSAAKIEELMGAHKALLANASHELRTPLARIRMAIELMKESADPKRKAGLEKDIAELDLLIDEILLASRLDTLADLSANEDVDLLALAAEECARVDDAEVDGPSIVVSGDPRLLRRMLCNLLENAVRHGAPPIHVQLSTTANTAEIRVGDNGPAIPQVERERVFEPFYRRRESRENAGSGLGLALVRQIARRHGGDARCVADAGGRNCFQVTLPARDGRRPA